MKPHYAGDKSIKFWEQINFLKDEKMLDAMYVLGIVLQDLEGRVLHMLNDAKDKEKKRGKKK